MKVLSLIVLMSSSIAFARAERQLCAGNKQLAKENIKRAAEQRTGSTCRIQKLKQYMSWPSEGLEGYAAEAKCAGTRTRAYTATIKKEDGVCGVRSVKLRALDGSQCGLTNTWGGDYDDNGEPVGDQWQFDESKQISLGELTDEQVRALPGVVKSQIVESMEEVSTVEEAIQAIKDGASEGGEAYHHQFTFKGVAYDAVEMYPGGNSVGKIFKHNSDQPVAENGDGSISCVE